MVSGAGWVVGHPGDAKIILLHHVPPMSHWTRWVYAKLKAPFLQYFDTVGWGSLLVETFNPAHFLTYERLPKPRGAKVSPPPPRSVTFISWLIVKWTVANF